MDGLNQFFESLSASLGTKMPAIVGVLLVLILGLLFAILAKRLVMMLFKKTKFDEKISSKFNTSFRLDKFTAKLVYFLILIFVLLMVLNMMGVQGVLNPLSAMLQEFFQFIPNIIAAIVIGYIGFMIATIAAEATGFLALTLQSISEKAGLKGTLSLENIVKKIVFILVFIPLLIAALDALKMEAISKPATDMFQSFLSAIPQIIAAVAILAVFYIGGKFLISLLTDLLKNLGVNKLADSMGISQVIGKDTSLSKLIGNIAFFFLMFGGVIAASDKLGFFEFTALLNSIFAIAGQVFFGLVILVIGNFIANISKNAIEQSEKNSWLGSLVKFVVLFIFLALGLSTMGIGQDIVNLAFGLSIGAVAVAFALSFGLGGREAAGKAMDEFLAKFREKN